MNDVERAIIKDLVVKGLTASEIITEMKSRLPTHRHHLLRYANVRNVSVRHNLPLTKGKGFPNKDELVLKTDCDNGINLVVDNEVEIEDVVKHEITSETVSCREHNIKYNQTRTVEQLHDEIAEKAQEILKAASCLVSKSSLISLSGKLTDILNDLNEGSSNQ